MPLLGSSHPNLFCWVLSAGVFCTTLLLFSPICIWSWRTRRKLSLQLSLPKTSAWWVVTIQVWACHWLHLHAARSGGEDGRRGGSSLPKDATTSLEGYTSHYPDTMENGTLTPVTPAKTGVFGETEVTVAADSNFNVDGSLPGNLDICHLVCSSGETTYVFPIVGDILCAGCD